jgi:putative aminopeptidase FrvX
MATKPVNTKNTGLKMAKKDLELLTRLCNAVAVSGDEQEVREIVLEQVKPIADTVTVDALGNVLATKLGKGKNKIRVMIAAHMDEVGFMLIKDEDNGIFEFRVVGGIDERQLVGKSVLVGREHAPAIIGAKAIHLTTPEERKVALKVDQLRIDLGPAGSSKVKIGDRATFGTQFQVIGPSLRSKALDDRLGVFNLIQLLKTAPDNIDLLAAFTVQEELGLRGARVAAYTFDPQIGIALDSTPANDLPFYDNGEENTRYNTRLDGGPAIYLLDGATIGDRRLIDWLVSTAEAEGIPWQYRQPGTGGTDAGAIHRTRAGVPSISVSVPQRYLHSAAGLVRMDDCVNTLRLMQQALARLDPKILNRQEK